MVVLLQGRSISEAWKRSAVMDVMEWSFPREVVGCSVGGAATFITAKLAAHPVRPQVSQRQMAVELAPALLEAFDSPFAPVDLPQPPTTTATEGATGTSSKTPANQKLVVDGKVRESPQPS